MKRLTPMQQELYQRVDEVLHYVWDPIGVAGDPATRDEYHSYLPHVFSLAMHGAPAADIAAYLTEVSVQKIGLTAAHERDQRVAELVVTWREALNERYA